MCCMYMYTCIHIYFLSFLNILYIFCVYALVFAECVQGAVTSENHQPGTWGTDYHPERSNLCQHWV